MNKPSLSIKVDKQDVSDLIKKKLISLSITDKRGIESDSFNLSISDNNSNIRIPTLGALIQIFVGWEGDGVYYKGIYFVDEVEYNSPPNIIYITGRAVNFNSELSTKKNKSWHGTLGYIIETIAQQYNLKLSIDKELKDINIDNIIQNSESDFHFITRIGKMFDAITTVKDENLIFEKIDKSEDKEIIINSIQIKNYHYKEHSRNNAFKAVKTSWWDVENQEKKDIIIGDDTNSKNIKIFSESYFKNEQEARNFAYSEWKRISRGKKKLSISLIMGNPNIVINKILKISGLNPDIDNENWLVVSIKHTIDSSGFFTEIELELSDINN